MKRDILAVMLAVAAPLAAAAPKDLSALMTQGRLEADLGNAAAAAEAFAAAAAEPGAPDQLRREALVRLGAARRASGDAAGAFEAFGEVWARYRQDPEALYLLVQAVDVAPDRERWEKIWRQVTLVPRRSGPHPTWTVQWPGASARRGGYSGTPVSLDFEDGALGDVFRLIADVSRLNVVVFPHVRGTVTLRLQQVPWDAALDRILAPHGLVARRQGNVLWIGPPERQGRPRRFTGRPADVDFKDLPLEDAVRRLIAPAGMEAAFEPGIGGSVTLRLRSVPWDQALDLMLGVHGLGWRREGTRIRVFQISRNPGP